MPVATGVAPDRQQLTIVGRFDAYEVAYVRAAVEPLLGARRPRVSLDLLAVDFMDCAALAEIVRIEQELRRSNGQLELVLTETVMKLLELTRSGALLAGFRDETGPRGTGPLRPRPNQPPASPTASQVAAGTDGTEHSELLTALVEAQDELVALQDLYQVGAGVDGFEQTMPELLRNSLALTKSDGIALLQRTDANGHQPVPLLTVGHDLHGVQRLARDTRAALRAGRSGAITGRGGMSTVALAGDRASGGIALGFARFDGRPYSTGDLGSIAAATSAVERLLTLTRLHEDSVHRATAARENELASQLAQSALDVPAPALQGLDQFFSCTPAHAAGGDFFATTVIDNVLHFAVGDVAGKGLLAAIVMTRAVSAARVAFLTHKADDPAGVIMAMNAELYQFLSTDDAFVTAIAGTFCPDTGELNLCNAGHSPVFTVVDGHATDIRPTTPPLGILSEARGATQTLHLHPGDLLVIGSDGLAEQEDHRRQLFGYDRLKRLCQDAGELCAPELGLRILRAVATHAGGVAQSDDTTLAIIGTAPGHGR